MKHVNSNVLSALFHWYTSINVTVLPQNALLDAINSYILRCFIYMREYYQLRCPDLVCVTDAGKTYEDRFVCMFVAALGVASVTLAYPMDPLYHASAILICFTASMVMNSMVLVLLQVLLKFFRFIPRCKSMWARWVFFLSVLLHCSNAQNLNYTACLVVHTHHGGRTAQS